MNTTWRKFGKWLMLGAVILLPASGAAPKPVPTRADIPYGSHSHGLLDV